MSYLAAGKAILAILPAGNAAAQTVAAAGAGRVVRPGDAEAADDALGGMLVDNESRLSHQRSARDYAAKNFDIEVITGRFEAVIHAAMERSRTSSEVGEGQVVV